MNILQDPFVIVDERPYVEFDLALALLSGFDRIEDLPGKGFDGIHFIHLAFFPRMFSLHSSELGCSAF